MDDWLKEAERKLARMPKEAKEVRERSLVDLEFFARLVNPGYMYRSVHKDIFRWMQEYSLYGQGGALTNNKLIMLPRAHLKSHMVATWCAWIITKHPEVTMLYVSATAELAETQLYAIQNILGSSLYQRFFPEYINPQEGKRDKWTSKKINVDHPKRAKEGIRDATVATAATVRTKVPVVELSPPAVAFDEVPFFLIKKSEYKTPVNGLPSCFKVAFTEIEVAAFTGTAVKFNSTSFTPSMFLGLNPSSKEPLSTKM